MCDEFFQGQIPRRRNGDGEIPAVALGALNAYFMRYQAARRERDLRFFVDSHDRGPYRCAAVS